MADEQGGMVRFTRLSRNYLGNGVFQLEEGDDFWIPERGFTMEPRTHAQPAGAALSGGADLTYCQVTILETGDRLEALETVADVIVRQEAALERTHTLDSTSSTP